MPIVLEWRLEAAPDETARRAAQSLADGKLVVLPTEAGYVVAADPARLIDPTRPPGLTDSYSASRLDGYDDLAAFINQSPSLSSTEAGLIRRLWPGAVGLMTEDAAYPAWVPSHLAAAAVLAAFGKPVALFEIDAARTVEPVEYGEAVEVIIDDGPPRAGPVTLIRVSDRDWQIERPGITAESAIRAALCRKIVFVCTGNTCRSPMAEGLFKLRLAAALGCSVEELPHRGFIVLSAGISALPGDAAAPEGVTVLQEWGVDLSGHRSRLATADLVARADDLIGMTRSHLLAVLTKYPAVPGALRLLCGADGDLDDPIGGGPEIYRACADVIKNQVDRLLTEMGFL